MTASALYTGSIRHRRFAVREHAFSHRVAMAYLDLDEAPDLLGGRLVRPGFGLQRFRRSDHLGDPAVPLDEAVRVRVAEELGAAPAGPIRVLTHLRTLGHVFNPVSFFYCFEEDATTLAAVVAVVTSTPWGERHAYVLDARGAAGRVARGDDLAKALHVSPFMGMDQRYAWRLAVPGETLSVHLENHEAGRVAFDATLGLRRRPLSRRTLAAVTARYPLGTLRVLALIYAHALVLALKRVPIQPRPAGAT